MAVLDIIFGAIEECLAPNAKLSQYQQQLPCLIRMNYLLKDVAYHVSVVTVQRTFHCTLDVLSVNLRSSLGCLNVTCFLLMFYS